MILTVTLNAAVDKTYRVEDFSIDRVHRPIAQWTSAGGKGINVSRVYRALGGESTATGFLGGINGRIIARSLRSEGIDSSFVRARSESRLCIAVVDPVTGSQTEVNEVGPEISAGELRRFRKRFSELLSARPWFAAALSGSLPPGVPARIYAELIHLARGAGVRAALDASGEALIAGMTERPWMAKPNGFELRSIPGFEARGGDQVAEAAESLIRDGTELMAVTLGRDGAVCASKSGKWRATPPPIDFVSAVGSGDSFLAAFLYTLEHGGECDAALRFGTAAGAANATAWGAGFISREQIESCAEGVRITRL